MKYVFLALFIISSVIHLYGSFVRNQKLRDATKGFILASLIGFYIFSVGVNNIEWVLILALFFSWLGDILLIPKRKKWFVMGGISFLVSHVFFIITYSTKINFSNIHSLLIVLFALIYATAVFIIFSKLKKHLSKPLFYPMFLYLLTNGCMNCFAIYRLISNYSIGSILTAIGALLFFISDCTLFFVRFDKTHPNRRHFAVMLTYSIGEFLILYGLILIK